ncbi:hypothetical protein AB0J80_29585 [Actinoplanes sp. NPDC049548]|uniref:hypothetical protein n=1 Tax=Actinoplanes sp. NPDC049548 TaxID=3155152 RepID=UPI00341F5BB3
MNTPLVLVTVAAAAFVSAFVPVSPIEPYLVAVGTAGHHGPVALGVAAGAGQTAGKLLIFVATRAALRSGRPQRWLAVVARRFSRPASRHRRGSGRGGALRRRLSAWGRWLTALLDRPALAAPVVLLSAVLGVPPLLATTVYAARTRISAPAFTLACLLGRSARFVAVAAVPSLLVTP